MMTSSLSTPMLLPLSTVLGTFSPGIGTIYGHTRRHLERNADIRGISRSVFEHFVFKHSFVSTSSNIDQYWNWFSHRDNLLESPLFDGSDTSMGGNGEFFKHNGSLIGGGALWLPSGNGGGCVKSGPFKEYGLVIHPV